MSPPTWLADLESASGTRRDLSRVVHELRLARDRWRESQHRNREPGPRELPSRTALARLLEDLQGVLFPMRLGPAEIRQESEDYYVGHTLDSVLTNLKAQVRLELLHRRRLEAVAAPAQDLDSARDIDDRAESVIRAFAESLPSIRTLIDSDVLAAFHGDPAAHSVDEVLLCYPGIRASIHHRIAHQLFVQGAPLLARLAAEIAHARTGIDIHPGASIGPGFFIDHGTGVVIGETARIGANVRLYQAVTLGAKRFERNEAGHLVKGGLRHPILEDDVVIYAGATILGRVTIGRGSTIGGNVWLTHSVPAGSHITQALARADSSNPVS